MGIIDELMGNTPKVTDFDIANQLLTDSKMGITMLAKTLTEVSNPELRMLLSRHLEMGLQEHFQLSDIATNKKWYQPYLSPVDQLRTDFRISQELT
ncbi:spore coat protein [Heliophilum fasciatum]|uniref:Coat F domain-containing protein n=1 Tax=Heliophilum fasciatum TaxID=35700 RepID=A0A4R2RVE9_9FIRM|nr:spore coat protein [Heliophilum fasciatum]MCW2277084.1 spore coat protein CotF [Heliophilum fasciatum]TCP68390.1 hypothetical protein EDD73_10319 [Heliophilum fasciatum]